MPTILPRSANRLPTTARRRSAYHVRLISAAFGLSVLTLSADSFTSDQIEFFEKQVRPVLAENCYKCHSTRSEKLKGGLLLDSREGLLKGGEDGLVIRLGEPDKSKLLEAVRYQNPDLQMPPKGKLPDEQIAALASWIKMGVPWPPGDGPKILAQNPTNSFDLDQRRREHWAWQPIRAQHPPSVQNKKWPSSPIDSFILARLEQQGLAPAPPADSRTLIRRLYFDLLGLPPSPRQVQTFVSNSSPNAYPDLVDELLASPRFGERWARHWLDLVRYAETLGHEFDYPIQNAWRYRDYVIRAFNTDVPYDQFVTEHIAGDLLPNPRRHPTEHFNESIIGTGFFWLGQRDHSPVDVRQHQAELIDNQIDVLSKTFLGLTVSCARCHDHKFDAISSQDFYSLYGVLESSRYAQEPVDSTTGTQIKQLKQLKKKIRLTALTEWSKQVQGFPESLPPFKKLPAPTHPLYPWAKLSAYSNAPPSEFRQAWTDLAREALASCATNPPLSPGTVQTGLRGWFADGDAFSPANYVEPTFVVGDSNVTILSEPAIDDRLLSRRLEGSLRSPGFIITNNYIHILAAGRESRLRVCVDNLTMIRDPIYGGLMVHLDQDEPSWLTFDLRMWPNHRAFIEFSDTAVPDPADDGRKSGYGKTGWLSVRRVVFSNEPAPAAPDVCLWLALLGPEAPDSLEALRLRYENAFKKALQLWKVQSTAERGLSSPHRPEKDSNRQEIITAAHLAFLDCCAASSATLTHLISEYHRIEASLPSPTRVPAMADGDGFDEHVFIRGNHKTLGTLAPRKFLTALSTGKDEPFNIGSGRLELARRITAPSDPLLARVMVNRVWLHLFGRGIVPTPDDFGKLGSPPTNPQLLDWLADWFRTDAHWSTKKLIRLLVTSSAYRMSSRPADALAEDKDPENLLLHRMPIRRLEGEAIRDALLAISGRFDTHMFGPSVPAYLTDFMEGRGRPASSGPLDGDGRRSIYLEVRRNFLSPMLRTFDTPVPFTTIGKRTVSNVPAQSLILLNDPFVLGQAQLWARRALAEPNNSPEQRINSLYETAFARPPTPQEVTKAREFLVQQAQSYTAANWQSDEKTWTDLCHVLFNLKEFIFLP